MTASSFTEFKDIVEVLDDITIDDDITINESNTSQIVDFKDLHLQKQDEHKEDNDDDTNFDDHDDWNILSSPVDFLVKEDDLSCNESEWDVLSSVQSVMSMETFHSSQIHRPTYSAIVFLRIFLHPIQFNIQPYQISCTTRQNRSQFGTDASNFIMTRLSLNLRL